MTNGLAHMMGTGKTLRWRIVAVLLVAALLPLSLAGFGSWVVFGKLLEEKSREIMRTLVQSHGKAIEAHLEERIHLLQLAAESNSLTEISDPKQLRQLLADLNSSSNKGFVDLGVFNSEGDHVGYVGPYSLQGLNYRETEWFKEVIVSDAYVSDVFPGFRQVPHCIVAVKKTTAEGESWILRATINSEQFDRLVQTSELGYGSDIYILNREGFYQTTPRSGTLLERAPGSLSDIHSGVREERVNIEGSEGIRATTWINDNRWLLVARQDLAAVQAPVDQAIADGALVVAVAIVLLIVTAFLATWHLTGRINKANAEREEMSRAFIRSAKLASIGELATGLAHEINNPLAIISAEQTNISDLLSDSEYPTQMREETLESIQRCKTQIQRCANITGKMLQFGRKRESQVEPTDIRPRLSDTIRLLERRAFVRNVKIRSEIEDDLPRALVDPVELEQVIVNLINNSIDAMPQGGTITVMAGMEENRLHLQVADSGTGIPQEDLERVFEPFFTTKPVGRGTGLGLSVCYGMVQSWGGSLKAESEQGKGTAMHIMLRSEPPGKDHS
ncbi:MAG: ATP-binding protein [bacterium]